MQYQARYRPPIVLPAFVAFSLSLFVAAPLAAASAPQSAAASAWGARAAAADADRSLEEMLRYAIQDEYLARAEYLAIMAKFGEMRPFSNILRSEESHIAWLKEAYAARSLPLPPDTAAGLVVAPTDLRQAYSLGVEAEIANIAMYDSFLASSLLGRSENAALKELFTRLRDASRNHLAAFQNGIAKF